MKDEKLKIKNVYNGGKAAKYFHSSPFAFCFSFVMLC